MKTYTLTEEQYQALCNSLAEFPFKSVAGIFNFLGNLPVTIVDPEETTGAVESVVDTIQDAPSND